MLDKRFSWRLLRPALFFRGRKDHFHIFEDNFLEMVFVIVLRVVFHKLIVFVQMSLAKRKM